MSGICAGRVVIITGARRGLGRAHALAFAREGARLVINDTGAGRDGTGGDHGPAETVAAEVRELGGDARHRRHPQASPARLPRVPARASGRARIRAGGTGPALDTGVAALAAKAVGGAEQALDLAVSHARQRIQFGRPIGSFQAVKLVALEGARAALDGTLAAAAGRQGDPGIAALVAGLQCSAAYTHITAEAIQVLGGTGFTWEHPAHLYFRRARTAAVLLGAEAQHRAALTDRLGL